MKPRSLTRRRFVGGSAAWAGSMATVPRWLMARLVSEAETRNAGGASLPVSALPKGKAPRPLEVRHFPDRLHAFVWRNWQLVPVERMAKVVGARSEEIVGVGESMGLAHPPRISAEQQRRSYITIIKRNWHLLPYEQLLELLEWTPEQMAYTLREDDFLYEKLGSLKPQCAPLRYTAVEESTRDRARAIAKIVREEFPGGLGRPAEPLFKFVSDLSSGDGGQARGDSAGASVFSPRYCYSYFALYGDPLMDGTADSYPEGYLARMAEVGADGVWLQAVLYKLHPFPWDRALSVGHQERLKNLRLLVDRARKHGIGIYLYLNEPRAMPVEFFAKHPELKGAVEGDHACLCTSVPEVQKYITEAVASICRAVPGLAGMFTISASENLTNCWSHQSGARCPRCSRRRPGEVISELHAVIARGISESGSGTRLIAWDWGWPEEWAADIIGGLPGTVALMSVSEWSIPIERGGVKSVIGEYSISTVGPGPRAKKHWDLARRRGLKTLAKIQAGNTWELSAVPYIPAVENVSRHAANLRETHVDGLMLGWTLGGYPSPNLEVIHEIGRSATATAEEAMVLVARRRFGTELAGAVVAAWRQFSAAFSEFPFGGGLYVTPMQTGPSNLLWESPTGYAATMVGFPYDDFDAWRAGYPAEVFVAQVEKMAAGFERGIADLKAASGAVLSKLSQGHQRAFQLEVSVAQAAAIHFRSTANQCRFVEARRRLAALEGQSGDKTVWEALASAIRGELDLARELYAIQSRDSRIGFEASNQYYYVPMDLAEKVLNCRYLLDDWLPRAKAG